MAILYFLHLAGAITKCGLTPKFDDQLVAFT